MSLDALIIFFGAVTAILPFLGFPIYWIHTIVFVLGLAMIALGIAVRRRLHMRQMQPLPFDGEEQEN